MYSMYYDTFLRARLSIAVVTFYTHTIIIGHELTLSFVVFIQQYKNYL
jgi:hypothetical protein